VYLRDLLVALRRRWYLVAAGLVLTMGLGYLALSAVSPTYTTTTSMLLIPPKNAVGPRGNPYLNLGNLTNARDALATRILADPVTEEITDENPNAEITVAADITSSGPILLIKVSAPSSQASILIRDRLAMVVPPTLDDMQRDLVIPPSSRITISTLASDPEPTKSAKSQLRAIIVVVGFGASATIIGTGLLDSFLTRRRSKSKASLNGEGASEGATEDASRSEISAQVSGSDISTVESMPQPGRAEVDQPRRLDVPQQPLIPSHVDQPRTLDAPQQPLTPNHVDQPKTLDVPQQPLTPSHVDQPKTLDAPQQPSTPNYVDQPSDVENMNWPVYGSPE
jgi:capsular polysaccharide biosynthesis protein